MNLELIAMRWLRFEKRCMLVMTERSPRVWSCGRPDVIGVTCARYVIEVEVKRSLSDFRADGRKRHRIVREHYLERMPKLFYYMVPVALRDAVLAELPEWAGLLTPPSGRYWIDVVRESPTNKASKRFTVKECVQMAHLLSNNAISAHERAENFKSNWEQGYHPYAPLWAMDYQI